METISEKRSRIVLATANARFHHASLSLRCLLANLGDLAQDAVMVEANTSDRPSDIAEKILSRDPEICAFSVYLWNVAVLEETVAIIKAVRPSVAVVLGGPEVSYPPDLPRIAQLADHIVAGEGELVFAELCGELIHGCVTKPKIIEVQPPNLESVVLPYYLYDERDISLRTIYVETGRGCPHGCEFCLSSRDSKVRRFPFNVVLRELDGLWRRGATKLKFLDRTLDNTTAHRLLDFFHDRITEGMHLHFEIVPSRISDETISSLARFPRGSIQLEVGVQTFNEEVGKRIGRNVDPDSVEEFLRRLLNNTNVHIHSDLVVGLPGENTGSFAEGFDRLFSTGVHEIQVGILKRLRGAPISRHDSEWSMVYNPNPPYDILSTSEIDYFEMSRLKRFARYFDIVHNSGNFLSFSREFLGNKEAFETHMLMSDWLFGKTGRTSSISQHHLAELLLEFSSKVLKRDERAAANALFKDFADRGQRRIPGSIRELADPELSSRRDFVSKSKSATPVRQSKHLMRDRLDEE